MSELSKLIEINSNIENDEYRKNPKRIVLTLKLKKSLYLLKQGQLSCENYSDKTISKWERAESTPDIAVLIEIAELFGVDHH